MKIDRRSFLAFVIGGAAGTALTPLPWKLTDDMAIWSQNWPWTPVPPRGESTYVTSACTLCPGGCGISVRKVGERVVKVEGLKDHPVNQGGICPLGLSGAQLLYWSERVPGPMKKVSGRWQPISWGQAVQEIAARLKELREKGQPQSVAWVSDSDRGTVAELCKRLLTVYGSPNFIRTPSMQDGYELALYLTQGQQALAGFDLANATFVLSFGSGLVEGWGSPPYIFRVRAALEQRGGKIGQLEARLSKTAAKADQFIPIQPGSEGAFALGLIHVILAEGLYRKEFLQEQCEGLEALKDAAGANYAPEAVSKLTGVEPQVIVALAKAFAGAQRPLAVCGRGNGRYTAGSAQEFLAVHYLNALAGSINTAGGIVAVPEPDYIDWPEPEMDAVASNGMQQPRLDGAGSAAFPLSRYLLNRLPRVLESGSSPALQALFVSSANPAYSQVDAQGMQRALERIPLVVSFSAFMDETAALAHYILPNHHYLERFEEVPLARGFPQPVISLVQPVVQPLLQTRHTGQVVMDLAKALGGNIAAAFGWKSYEACLQQSLGDKWDTLKKKGYWVQKGFAPGQFETRSRKFEFTNPDIAKLAPYKAVQAPGDAASLPLTLIPFDTLRLAAGDVGSPPFLVKSLEDIILQKQQVRVQLNPADARKLGLDDEAEAVLTTPQGSARVKVYLSEGIMPGLVAMVRGLGHTAYGRFLNGKGVNVNGLMPSVEDPATGFEAAWGVRARLTRA